MQPLNVKTEDASAPDQAQQPTAEPDQQTQSKGPLSGMVSMARGVLGRRQTGEAPPSDSNGAPGQPSTANDASPVNNV
jgi:hypothetical protein